jgi:protoporphyrin/coproporphyrin ferrochelatase
MLKSVSPAGCRSGVLLVNVGSPSKPTYRAVYRYLRQFLSDRRVVDLPRLLWIPLLRFVILPSRSLRSARAYRGVWQADGSPLVSGTRAVAAALGSRFGSDVTVAVAMRYGEPSIDAALAELRAAGVTDVTVLPLYPQYCRSTTGTVVAELAACLDRGQCFERVVLMHDYHADPAYIGALATSVREVWATAPASHLVLSFHGLPVSYIRRGDPYQQQVEGTAEALARRLGLSPADWTLSYQSRFPLGRWLGPETDQVLADLARRGQRRATVVTPGFPVECLETLRDIRDDATRAFLGAGGEALDYVPALGTRLDHVDALLGLIRPAAGLPLAAADQGANAAPGVRGTNSDPIRRRG